MVLQCAWGTCNADERYLERLEGGHFICFPTPKHNLEKVKQWIKACGRPHEQLNIARINQHKAVCSKHFVGGNGPTENYSDPIQADGSRSTPARKLLVKRAFLQQNATSQHKRKCLHLKENTTILNSPDMNCESGVSTQTESPWISAMDILAVAAENQDLSLKLSNSSREIQHLQLEVSSKDKEIQHLKKIIAKKTNIECRNCEV